MFVSEQLVETRGDVRRMDARTALADALGAELDIDLSPKFVAATDRVLMRLWLHGFRVTPFDDDDLTEENLNG